MSVEATAAFRLALGTASDAALAYAWCKVCFTAWDATLDAAGEKILKYSRWPEALRCALQALYPAYFVYSGMKKLSGPEGPQRPADVRRWTLLLSLVSALVALLGLRAGQSARLKAARAAA